LQTSRDLLKPQKRKPRAFITHWVSGVWCRLSDSN